MHYYLFSLYYFACPLEVRKESKSYGIIKIIEQLCIYGNRIKCMYK